MVEKKYVGHFIKASVLYVKRGRSISKIGHTTRVIPILPFFALYTFAALYFIQSEYFSVFWTEKHWIGLIICGAIELFLIYMIFFYGNGVLFLWRLSSKGYFNKGFPEGVLKSRK